MRTLIFGLVAFLLGQSPSTTALKTIEDGVLDRITLFANGIAAPQNLTVIIRPFDATAAELGTGGEAGKQSRREEAQTMQQEGPRVLADRFVSNLEKGPFKVVRTLKENETVPADALVVEGKFVTLDPGSRTKRYFAGFGAGKSSVKVTGTVKDGHGQTLATFEQRRIGAMGFGGGDSLGKLMADSRNIGEDIATFLAKWARGQSLK